MIVTYKKNRQKKTKQTKAQSERQIVLLLGSERKEKNDVKKERKLVDI